MILRIATSVVLFISALHIGSTPGNSRIGCELASQIIGCREHIRVSAAFVSLLRATTGQDGTKRAAAFSERREARRSVTYSYCVFRAPPRQQRVQHDPRTVTNGSAEHQPLAAFSERYLGGRCLPATAATSWHTGRAPSGYGFGKRLHSSAMDAVCDRIDMRSSLGNAVQHIADHVADFAELGNSEAARGASWRAEATPGCDGRLLGVKKVRRSYCK